ncbi:MAG: hypothetical protein LCI03_18890 [Actinobacteria bacterium]|nr:hypothetical protein [Actinomycetota bacterium]
MTDPVGYWPRALQLRGRWTVEAADAYVQHRCTGLRWQLGSAPAGDLERAASVVAGSLTTLDIRARRHPATVLLLDTLENLELFSTAQQVDLAGVILPRLRGAFLSVKGEVVGLEQCQALEELRIVFEGGPGTLPPLIPASLRSLVLDLPRRETRNVLRLDYDLESIEYLRVTEALIENLPDVLANLGSMRRLWIRDPGRDGDPATQTVSLADLAAARNLEVVDLLGQGTLTDIDALWDLPVLTYADLSMVSEHAALAAPTTFRTEYDSRERRLRAQHTERRLTL